ncbi:MAG TPA: hypothetical protein DC024_11040, partial [Clostridiales bacterium]|nr:hypothetical protein [Clostridiales bacterium]
MVGGKMNKKVELLQPISKDLLYMKVADAIYNYIHINNLHPGEKIPSERSLAKYLNTGRNSVREALRVLENQDVIEVQTGKGIFVKRNTISGSIYFKLVKINYLEIIEIKAFLEQKVIEKIIHSITPAQCEKLECYLRAMESAAKDDVYSAADDFKFHKIIIDASPNKTMGQMIFELRKVLDNYAMEFKDTNSTWIYTIPYHRELLNAFKEGNLKKACDAHNKIYKTDISLFSKFYYVH